MIVLLIISAVALVAVDQIVKYWAVNTLQPVHTMDFIKFGDFKVIDLTYLENKGAIFGSMSGQKWFLIGVTSIIIAVGIAAMFFTAKKSKFFSTCIMLFVSGGMGNLIDRVRLGYVVDMFEIKLFRFAIFNFADICVTCAFVMMFIYLFFIEPHNEKKLKATEAEENV